MYSIIFFLLVGISLVCDKFIYLQDEKNMKTYGFNHIYHVYFAIVSSYMNEPMETRNLFTFYFIIDILIQYYKKSLSKFTFIHHILSIIIMTPTYSLLNVKYYDYLQYVKVFQGQEIPNIILNSYIIGIIPENIYKILYPILFYYYRVFIFNLDIYKYTKHYIVYFTAIILNIINIYISIKMYVRIKKYLSKKSL